MTFRLVCWSNVHYLGLFRRKNCSINLEHLSSAEPHMSHGSSTCLSLDFLFLLELKDLASYCSVVLWQYAATQSPTINFSVTLPGVLEWLNSIRVSCLLCNFHVRLKNGLHLVVDSYTISFKMCHCCAPKAKSLFSYPQCFYFSTI